MEIKKKKIINIISIIITLSLFLGMMLFYMGRINANFLDMINILIFPNMLIIDVILVLDAYILFKYIQLTLKLLFNKKVIKGLLMILLFVIILSMAIYVLIFANSYLRLLVYTIFMTLEFTIIPIIFLIMMIWTTRKKSTKIKLATIIITLIIVALIWITQFNIIKYNFKVIENVINETSGTNLFANAKQTRNENISNDARTNLLNHLNIQEQRGYIFKDEILKNILPSINSYKVLQDLDVSYIDEKNSKDITVNTKSPNWKEEIKSNIDGDYFKLKYEYRNDYSIKKITIERIGTNTQKDNEKNSNIKFGKDSILDFDLIDVIKIENATPDSNIYTFENSIKQNQDSKTLEQFKIGFAYDETKNNFIPIKSDKDSYDGIKSYKIYSTGIQITLNKGTSLQKKYCTMRINRYDSDFEISKSFNYKYMFEPVVTEMSNSNGEVVLELNFEQTYLLRQLKNIEIIFGSM